MGHKEGETSHLQWRQDRGTVQCKASVHFRKNVSLLGSQVSESLSLVTSGPGAGYTLDKWPADREANVDKQPLILAYKEVNHFSQSLVKKETGENDTQMCGLTNSVGRKI